MEWYIGVLSLISSGFDYNIASSEISLRRIKEIKKLMIMARSNSDILKYSL